MSEKEMSTALDELVALTLNGEWEKAFDKFYHNDLEKTDLDGVIVKGKAASIENGRIFSSRISNVRDFSCSGIVIKENRSFLIWSFDFDVDGKPFKLAEVAVQDWEEGRIIKERFFA
jgi:hypothetical protein